MLTKGNSLTEDAIPPDEPNWKAVGKLIRSYRERSTLSRDELADLVGPFDMSYISKIELGIRRPSRTLLQRIGESCRLSPMELSHLFLSCGYVPPDDLQKVILDELIYLRKVINELKETLVQ